MRLFGFANKKKQTGDILTLSKMLGYTTDAIRMRLARILEFLNQKGYRVEAYRLYLPPKEEMLVSEKELLKWSFCALKPDEMPSSEKDYLKVFEKEIKRLLRLE